jgi:hypothetical protein
MQKIRSLYNEAHLIQSICLELIELTKGTKEPVVEGYHAASLMVATKYLKNPFKIITEFNRAKNLLEEIISENFAEVELRYLRYSIQKNTPKFVGYYKNIEEDRLMIVQFVNESNENALRSHILLYLQGTQDMEGISS